MSRISLLGFSTAGIETAIEVPSLGLMLDLGHQAFFTENALRDIARTTIGNVTAFERREPLVNAVP